MTCLKILLYLGLVLAPVSFGDPSFTVDRGSDEQEQDEDNEELAA